MADPRRFSVPVLALILVTGLSAGCSGPPSKSAYISDVDAICADVHERAAELPLAGPDRSFALNDGLYRHLDEHRLLAEEMRREIRQEPPPADDRARFDEWMKAVDDLVETKRQTGVDFRESGPDNSLVLALYASVHDGYAETAGEAAGRYGLQDCSDTRPWQIFPEY